MTDATQAVLQEIADRRTSMLEDEGWSAEGDDGLTCKELSLAAQLYMEAHIRGKEPPMSWPFSRTFWEPSTYRNNLIKAGAFIVAEIERLDRKEKGGE